jgi:hypothetical protein
MQLVRLLEESELVSPEICKETEGLGLFDFEAAVRIVEERRVPVDAVRHGLKEHARVILGYLLQLKRGAFFFQPGQIARKRDLQFRLLITDILLKTAAEMDEKTRVLGASPGEK